MSSNNPKRIASAILFSMRKNLFLIYLTKKQNAGINIKKNFNHIILNIEEYYFSVVDVEGALTDSNIPRNYWSD